jgi:hypothetical protein
MRLPSKVKCSGTILLVCVFLGGSAMARNWPWRHAKAAAAAQTQDDSAAKKPAQDSPAQEQPAQNQPAPDKSEAKPPSQDKPAEAPGAQEPAQQEDPKQDSKKNDQPAPAEPNQAAPGANAPNSSQPSGTQAIPAPASSEPGSSPDAKATQTGTPETPASGAAGEAPTPSTENSNPSSPAKVSNHNHKNSNRTKIIHEGGTADASALLSPSLTLDQASSQIQKTTELLNSAERNLQKISTRKLNPDQQAMLDQVHTYVRQAKDALNRGDLPRGHNLALKANLLADDLARH